MASHARARTPAQPSRRATPRSEPAPRRATDTALQLQRAAGNRATAALLAGPVTAQRQHTEDLRTRWGEMRGQTAVDRALTAATDWRVFRSAPASHSGLPDSGGLNELADIVGAMDAELRRYTADLIGSESLAMLSELTGFVPASRRLIGLLPRVAYVDPQHRYTMTTAASGKAGPVEVPVSIIAVEYANAYGWHWRHELVGSTLSWGVGISGSRKGPKASLLPEAAAISIGTQAKAKSVPYWGYDDLAGVILVANGPKVKISVMGMGGGLSTGGVITLRGGGGSPPGPLNFDNVSVTPSLSGVNVGSPGNWQNNPFTEGLKLSLTLIQAGVGIVAGGSTVVATPEIEPVVVTDEQIWKYILGGFETGAADIPIPPDEVHPLVEMMADDLGDKQRNFESLRPYLEDAGAPADWRLSFFCEGYASRRWSGAATDAERQDRNLDLSLRRAQNVAAELRARFGPDHQYDATGRGGAFYEPDQDAHGHQAADVVPEADETLERWVEREVEEFRAQIPHFFPEEQVEQMVADHRAALLKKNQPVSDLDMARRVNITVVWRGPTIRWGQLASPAPVPVP